MRCLIYCTPRPAPWCSKMLLCSEPQAEVVYSLLARIGDYTDFYTSIYHATNVGNRFAPTTR